MNRSARRGHTKGRGINAETAGNIADRIAWNQIRKLRELDGGTIAKRPFARARAEDFNVGDIIYDSWGYDQTNYDFAQIVEISKSRKTVKAQMMKAKTVKTTRTSDVLVPTETYGIEFRLWVRKSWRGQPAFVGQYPYIYSDQDSKRKGCFTHWEGDPVHKTNTQYGH